MKIVWDEPKRLANIEKHGLDFSTFDGEFFLGSLVLPAKSGRFKAIGKLGGSVVAVVFARLGIEGVSVVSMRAASRTERSRFDEKA